MRAEAAKLEEEARILVEKAKVEKAKGLRAERAPS